MTNTTRRTKTIRTTIAATAVVTASLLLASCSSADSGSGGSSSSQDALQGKRLESVKCLRDKGYDPPDPDPDNAEFAVPEGADPDQYVKDAADCDDAAGINGAGAGSEAEEPRSLEEEYAPEIAKCMREMGYADFPDDADAFGDFMKAAADPEAAGEDLRSCLEQFLPDEASQR